MSYHADPAITTEDLSPAAVAANIERHLPPVLHTVHEPLFMVAFDDDFGRYKRSGMLLSNAHDPELCAWLMKAEIGEAFRGVSRVA